MFINSHFASAYILARIIENEKRWIFLWLFAALFPDIDGLWSKSVVEHHSILHTPFFWFLLCGLGFLVGYTKGNKDIQKFFIIIFFGSFLHLFTDYLTARTVGIKWFYPFISTDYYVYNIMPEKGNIAIWEMLIPPYISFYFENIVLSIFEISLNIMALLLYFFSGNKTNFINKI